MRTRNIDFEKKVFDIKDEPMPKGSWWWWFWLFFFDNPKNPKKPRQLMILWSTKNEKVIDCNGTQMIIGPQDDRSHMDGAVAAWYFDGKKMNHNFLLDPCKLRVTSDSVTAETKSPSTFSVKKKKSIVRIGKGMEFVSEMIEDSDFTKPEYHENKILGDMGYNILRVNKLKLSGIVDGKKIKGTSYFQRVFVNAPSPPWYWGIFHFDNGGVLSYFNPNAFGKSIKQDISLFDGRKMHEIKNIRVKRKGGDAPDFEVSGENEKERISFTVNSYEHSSWTFRKKFLGIIPNKLVYNEYPATVSGLVILDKKTGKRTKMGNAIGNAEHTTGMLL